MNQGMPVSKQYWLKRRVKEFKSFKQIAILLGGLVLAIGSNAIAHAEWI
ncbi:MAG: hypothetical protein JO166_11495 [Deltaproteobacteria bacterium]|nr:hypothetical protein [Deltaproteobacteria bacterium]